MAETFGYNLAEESVKLFGVQEAHSSEIIDTKNKQVENLVARMEHMEHFLALVAQRTDDSNRVDLIAAEEQEMVDRLRNEGLEHIFPHGKYTWKEQEIDNLKRLVSQHLEGPLAREINRTTEEIMLEQHEQSKAVELFNGGLKRMNNLIERIMNNIQRAH